MRELRKEEEKKKTEEFPCKNCAYSDLNSDFCYVIQDKPDRNHPKCSFLEWKTGETRKTESSTDVRDLLPKPIGETKSVEKKESTTVYSTYSYKKCHTGTIHVFSDKKSGISICGGGKSRDVTVKPGDLFLDVGFNCDRLIETSGLKQGWKLQKYNKPEAMIKIDWSDGGAPNLPEKFWTDLVALLREEKRRVVVSCVGGHGRTGTVLSILSVFMGAVKKSEDPVAFVRKKYCEEAVETKSQCDYIEKITGCKVGEKPSHYYGGTSYYANWPNRGGNYSEKEDKKEDSVTKTAIKNLKEMGIYDLLI